MQGKLIHVRDGVCSILYVGNFEHHINKKKEKL